MMRGRNFENIDPELARRVASLRPSGQRWLKTVLHTIRTMPSPRDVGDDEEEERRYRPPLPERLAKPAQEKRPRDLDDVILGKANLEDEMANYPELAGELEGLGDIIDMLRDIGQARRKRGEEILREDILGSPPSDEGEEE